MAQAALLASTALGLLDGPLIPYVAAGTTLRGMDCQGLVKYCAKQCGLTLKYSGSNDMFRNACTDVWTLAEAKKAGKLVPGAVCFILERTGDEPDKYKRDGIGNASHIGVVTLSPKVWSVDASASACKVRSRDESNATHTWTHIGWLKEVEYEMIKKDRPTQEAVPEPASTPQSDPQPAVAPKPAQPTPSKGRVTGSQRLNLRRSPRLDGERIGGMEPGTPVEILESLDEWYRVRAKINGQYFTGWALGQYIQL